MTKTILFRNIIKEFTSLNENECIRFEYNAKHVRMTGYNDRGGIYIEYIAVLEVEIDKIDSENVDSIKNIQKVTNLSL
jgi:hypothetical protein